MIKHPEIVRKTGPVTIERTGDFHTISAEITTAGNIKKVLKLSESEASALVAALSDALDSRPANERAVTFLASLQAGHAA